MPGRSGRKRDDVKGERSAKQVVFDTLIARLGDVTIPKEMALLLAQDADAITMALSDAGYLCEAESSNDGTIGPESR